MKALLVVDIQKGLTLKKPLHDFAKFVHTVNCSINKYREAEDLIIFIQHNNRQLQEFTGDWEVDDRIDKQKNDLIIQKFHGNAFLDTDLETVLVAGSIKEILICGLVSHGCVKYTCLGGLKLGFRTALLRNGHTNWNKNAEMVKALVEKELIDKGVEMEGVK